MFICLDPETSHAPATLVTSFILQTAQLVMRLINQKQVKEMETHTKETNPAYQSCARHLVPLKMDNYCLQRVLTTLEI